MSTLDTNAPVYGCVGCNTTAGRMGCPDHGARFGFTPLPAPTEPLKLRVELTAEHLKVATLEAELARLRSVLEWAVERAERGDLTFHFREELLRRGVLVQVSDVGGDSHVVLAWHPLATAAPAQPSAQQEEEAPQ